MTKELLEQLVASISAKIDRKVRVIESATDGEESPYPEGTLCLVLGSGSSSGGSGGYYFQIPGGHIEDGVINVLEECYTRYEDVDGDIRYYTDAGKTIILYADIDNGSGIMDIVDAATQETIYIGENIYQGGGEYMFDMPDTNIIVNSYR